MGIINKIKQRFQKAPEHRWTLDRMLGRVSLANKMLIILIGAILVPQFIQTFYFYTETEQSIQRELLEKLNAEIDDNADRLNNSLLAVVALSKSYHTNIDLYRYLDFNYERDFSYYITYQEKIRQMIGSDFPYYLQLKQIMIYTDNPTMFNGAYVRKMIPLDGVTFQENYSDLCMSSIKDKGEGVYLRVAVVPQLLSGVEDRSLSIVRVLDYYDQLNNYNMILRIDLNVPYLISLLTDSGLFENVYLVDRDNRILLASGSYRNVGSYDIFNPDDYNDDIILLERSVGSFPLRLYGLYDSGTISEQFSDSRWKMLEISLITFGIAVLCIMLVAGNLTKRVKVLVKQSRQIAQGNFIQNPIRDNGTDEISAIETSMDQMSNQLQTLIEREYHAKLRHIQLEQESTQAKLLALQSQINPHFFFNALESIRLKAIAKDETETALMIKYMSRMFRHIIDWNDDVGTLADSITFLQEFLEIQKYRFGDEFQYSIHTDEAALCCLLPKFIIQPLVENACVHGVEAVSNLREISIDAHINEGMLCITVVDNGGGMTPERLQEIRAMLTSDSEASASSEEAAPGIADRQHSIRKCVGLNNVYQRLLLYYGEHNFSFDIQSVYHQGTTCVVMLPCSTLAKASGKGGEDKCTGL